MVKLALSHAPLPQYLRDYAGEADQKNLQLVLSADRREQFLAAAGSVRVDALVVDLTRLGERPEAVLEELERAFNPELSLVVYAFAKWELIERLRGPRGQLLRAPASAAAMSPEATMLRLEQQPSMRRYDGRQLAALQDVKSLVDCECPNQVADLVLALNAVEACAAQYQSRDEKDAQIHRMRARVTGHARGAMECALRQLRAFENIDPAALARPNATKQRREPFGPAWATIAAPRLSACAHASVFCPDRQP
ncbi:MAG: hypothetical protein ACOVKS_05525 [Aquimonas sp.]